MNSPTKKDARIAGAIYLSLLPLGVFSLIYVPSKLVVRGNAGATAQNVLSHETLFRFGIVAELLGTVAFIFVAFALYRLLSSVNRDQAAIMLILAVMSVPISFVGAADNFAALTLFRGGDFLSVLPKVQLDALGMFMIRLRDHTILANEMFWGLWLLPLGLLIIRSRLLPRLLGLWLILAGFGWIADSITVFVAPEYIDAVNRVTSITRLAEIALILWLLIMGIKVDMLRE